MLLGYTTLDILLVVIGVLAVYGDRGVSSAKWGQAGVTLVSHHDFPRGCADIAHRFTTCVSLDSSVLSPIPSSVKLLPLVSETRLLGLVELPMSFTLLSSTFSNHT